MARETVDFGIDLGTTNSAIAMSTGADADIVRNNLRDEYTPSAVHINRSGHVLAGHRARGKLDSDPANTHAEFKLQMGVRDARRTFEESGRSMSPEELSAEVLKALRQDVLRASGEEIGAAVITVPAAFELDQCDATRRAAALAGLGFAPLLQEPTAAAWAYSAVVRDVPRRGFWLVYDLGGGTFDAAVIQVQDGEFAVVNHAGDNFLGGKMIDWLLVEEVLIPAARAIGPAFASLDRSDPRHAGNIARLKIAAEEAKIELSQFEAVEVELTLFDAQGKGVPFLQEMTRADVERAAMPLYRRSVELCRTALAEKSLTPGDIERVLLVGGATLAPALRALLSDPVDGLGIRLDHSLDPVTVVARGAAVFARTQRLPHGFKHLDAEIGDILLDFAHKPTGRATDPLVGGQARTTDDDKQAGDRDWTGYTIEFVNVNEQDHMEWRSGQIPLTAGGTFTTRLSARGSENTYEIEFRTPQGVTVPTNPDSTTYQRMGMEGGDATLSHSLGVWVEGNEVAWLLRKGTELPAKGRIVLESTLEVRRGQHTGLIRVPIVQGERGRADRNPMVGQLDIRPDEISRDVPAGSEIEVVVEVGESFDVHVDAYVPILDEEFEIAIDLGRDTPDVDGLRAQSEAVAGQYEELRRRSATSRADRTTELLDEFDERGGLGDISRELDSAQVNPDGPAITQELLREAETALDHAEEALKLPQLLQEAESVREWVCEVVAEHGDADRRGELRGAEADLDSAVVSGDPTLVAHQTEVVRNLGLRVLDDVGQLPALQFMALREQFAMSTEPQVRRLLHEGERAMAADDSNFLRSTVIQLSRLVPKTSAAPERGVDTTVRRYR